MRVLFEREGNLSDNDNENLDFFENRATEEELNSMSRFDLAEWLAENPDEELPENLY